jgi:Gram-negative bacterial TonB protein C-terminal
MIASLFLLAAIAQAEPSESSAGCPDTALRIALPTDIQPPTMPFGAPVPAAQAVISVIVAQDGHLVSENIFGGSGYSSLDLAAYTLIHRSRFTPKTVNCKAVSAYQLFVVDFSQMPPAVTPAPFPSH